MGSPMATKEQRAKKRPGVGKSVRTSVSLPRELHEILAQMARGKKVSVAWVIRDAAEKYVSEQWPLLGR
jgi:predicted DNA-binding ribbon-helix-helix protein